MKKLVIVIVAVVLVAAIAVGISLKVRNDRIEAQKEEERRQELLHFGDKVEQATNDYNAAAQKLNDFNIMVERRTELLEKKKLGQITADESKELDEIEDAINDLAAEYGI